LWAPRAARPDGGGGDGEQCDGDEDTEEYSGSELRDGTERACTGIGCADAEGSWGAGSAAVSEVETSPVGELKARLSEAQTELASARADADERARQLQERPSRELQLARNEASERAELIDLTIQRLQRDLEAAEATARQDGIQERLTAHSSDVMGPAAASERRAREHVAGLEHELAELLGYRNATRGTVRALMALGYEDLAGVQLGIREDKELVRRLEALAGQYVAALKMVRAG
jgi:hypothetical protein